METHCHIGILTHNNSRNFFLDLHKHIKDIKQYLQKYFQYFHEDPNINVLSLIIFYEVTIF